MFQLLQELANNEKLHLFSAVISGLIVLNFNMHMRSDIVLMRFSLSFLDQNSFYCALFLAFIALQVLPPSSVQHTLHLWDGWIRHSHRNQGNYTERHYWKACKDENIVTTVIRQYANKEKPCNGEKVLMVLWSFRLTFLICKIMHEPHTKHSA